MTGLRDRGCKKTPVPGSFRCPNGDERKTTAPQMINEARLRGIKIHLDATSDVIEQEVREKMKSHFPLESPESVITSESIGSACPVGPGPPPPDPPPLLAALCQFLGPPSAHPRASGPGHRRLPHPPAGSDLASPHTLHTAARPAFLQYKPRDRPLPNFTPRTPEFTYPTSPATTAALLNTTPQPEGQNPPSFGATA